MSGLISQQLFVGFCLTASLFSAAILLTIAPHLIAVISFLFVLLAALFSIKLWHLSAFSTDYILLCLLLLVLSTIVSIYHVDYSAIQNVVKLICLSLPFCLVFPSFLSYKLFDKPSMHTALTMVFYVCLVGCLLQLAFSFAIKNAYSNSTVYDHIGQLNDLVIAACVFIWLISAICRHFSAFKDFSVFILPFSFIILLSCLLFANSAAALLAFVMSLFCFFLTIRFNTFSKIFIKGLIILFLLFFLFIPRLVYQQGADSSLAVKLNSVLGISALHRIDIWEKSVGKILERPLTGWGNSNSSYLDLEDKPSIYSDQIIESVFAYPHNIFLQITLELGLLGLIILLLLLNQIINAIYRLHTTIRPYAAACFISVNTIWMLSYPLWRSWWLVFIGLLATSFAALSQHQQYSEYE